MKISAYIAFFILLAGCNPDGIGCFKSSGQVETITIDVAEFTEIDVSGNIEVHISSDSVKPVQLTAGANIISGIRIEVVDGVLFLDNLNTCNWSREYVNPVVEISQPSLSKIAQHGFGEISSIGTLIYDELTLENIGGSGDFVLDVNLNSLNVVSNEVANFHLSGSTTNLEVLFAYHDEIFFGEDLLVDSCIITHYGSNSIHLNVTESLKGTIYSYGDIIIHRQMPQIIEVAESENGKLIFVP